MKTSIKVILVSLFLSVSCGTVQSRTTIIDCAVLDTVLDAGQLLQIVQSCSQIAVSSDAIIPCITAASNSKWTTDVIGCFNATVNHGALNPPIVPAIEKLKAQ